MKMKVILDSSKKINLSINVLPDKYKRHLFTFKHFVIFLATLCALAIIVLTYQFVLDSIINTRELQYDVELLTQRFNLKRIDINRINGMKNAIADYDEISVIQVMVPDDVQGIINTADATGLQLVDISHTGDEIELHCPAASAYTDYGVAIAALNSFKSAITAQERFVSVDYLTPPYSLPDYVKITITLSEA